MNEAETGTEVVSLANTFSSSARIKVLQPVLNLTNQGYKVQQTCLQNRRKLMEIDIPDKQHVHEIQLDLRRKE